MTDPANPATPAASATPPPPAPWWRHGSVWLLLSGPAIVVVASLATAYIAARGADQLVDQDAWRQGRLLEQKAAERALAPAMQARNHAATPATGNR